MLSINCVEIDDSLKSDDAEQDFCLLWAASIVKIVTVTLFLPFLGHWPDGICYSAGVFIHAGPQMSKMFKLQV